MWAYPGECSKKKGTVIMDNGLLWEINADVKSGVFVMDSYFSNNTHKIVAFGMSHKEVYDDDKLLMVMSNVLGVGLIFHSSFVWCRIF